MAKIKTLEGVKEHKVVSPKEWLFARKKFLVKEKKLTKLRDQLAKERRALPWEKVEQNYLFDGPEGKETLADLFGDKSQLVVWHFMLGKDWKEGCEGCSFWADSFNGNIVHMAAKDITMIAVSRAPMKKIEAYKKRMGWSFKWVSSQSNSFNVDYRVSSTPEEFRKGKGYYNYETVPFTFDEMPGASAFYKDDKGDVYHTYSTFGRGMDPLNAGYQYIDLTAKGRNEPAKNPSHWVRRHDQYGK